MIPAAPQGHSIGARYWGICSAITSKGVHVLCASAGTGGIVKGGTLVGVGRGYMVPQKQQTVQIVWLLEGGVASQFATFCGVIGDWKHLAHLDVFRDSRDSSYNVVLGNVVMWYWVPDGPFEEVLGTAHVRQPCHYD